MLQSTNGALKDYSEAALSRELAFYRESHQELEAIARETLLPHLQVDHRMMDAQLKFLIRLIGERKYHQRAVDTYTAEPFRGVDWQLQQMQDLGNGLRGTEPEWRHVVSRVESIHAYLEHAKANLDAGRRIGNVPDWRMVQRSGVDPSMAAAEYFRTTLPETASRFDHFPFGNAQLRTRAVVRSVAERYDRVEAVVAAGELNHDQDVVVRQPLERGRLAAQSAREDVSGAQEEVGQGG